MKKATSRSVREKKPSITIQLPVRELKGVEGIALGFRSDMVSCEHGGVACGAGFGSEWISIDWKGKQFAVRGTELLAAVVRTFNPEDADAILGAEVTGDIAIGVASSGE